MSHWYMSGSMKFEKVSKTEYTCGAFSIVNLNGYHLAFHKKYLLNRDKFSKSAAYLACVKYAEENGL